MNLIIIKKGIVSQRHMELILVFIMLRKMVVTEGHADQVVKKFSKEGPIEQQEGFIDLTVMKQKARQGEEAIVVMIRWESEDHWKQWEKSISPGRSSGKPWSAKARLPHQHRSQHI